MAGTSIIHGSSEVLRLPWEVTPDPRGSQIEASLMPVGQVPTPSSWVTVSWDPNATDPYLVLMPVGPGHALDPDPGQYGVYSRLAAETIKPHGLLVVEGDSDTWLTVHDLNLNENVGPEELEAVRDVIRMAEGQWKAATGWDLGVKTYTDTVAADGHHTVPYKWVVDLPHGPVVSVTSASLNGTPVVPVPTFDRYGLSDVLGGTWEVTYTAGVDTPAVRGLIVAAVQELVAPLLRAKDQRGLKRLSVEGTSIEWDTTASAAGVSASWEQDLRADKDPRLKVG